MSILLDIDPLTGARETFDFDENEETAIIRRTADVQPVIDRNTQIRNHGTQRSAGSDLDMRLSASIPIEVCYLWLQKFGIKAWDKRHWPDVKRLLNSNEWRYLRTNELYL